MQTEVNLVFDRGYPGIKAADNGGGVIRGALKPLYNTSGATLPFGVMVVLKTGSTNEVELPDSDTDIPFGLLIHNEYRGSSPSVANYTNQGVLDQSQASVYTVGFDDYYVLLDAAADVEPGDDVYFRHNAPGSEQLGACTNTNSADHAQWTGVSFVTPDIAVGTLKIAAINISDPSVL